MAQIGEEERKIIRLPRELPQPAETPEPAAPVEAPTREPVPA